jgi:hypothetical protein
MWSRARLLNQKIIQKQVFCKKIILLYKLILKKKMVENNKEKVT